MLDRLKLYKQLLSTGVTDHGCLFCEGCDSNIIRGSTIRHSFKLSFNVELIEDILIIYKQDDKKILEKKLVDVKVYEDLIYYNLSELDTLKFKPDKEVQIQLRISLKDKRIINTKIFKLEVYDIVDDQIITDESINYYALEANVNAQKIDVRKDFDLVQNSDGLYKCKLLFDSTWNKFIKRVVFKDQYNHKIYTDVIEDCKCHYECILPDLIIERPGLINMGVIGSHPDGNVAKPTMWSNSIRVPRSCLEPNELDKLEFDKIYVYQGVVDNAYEFTTPQELEVVAITKADLLSNKGYTWDGYWLDNQYHVLAIPTNMNIECEKVVQNDYTILPTYHTSSENGNYIFYYFSSKATGTFTSTYYFKEVK